MNFSFFWGTEKVAVSLSENPKEVTEEANCVTGVAGVVEEHGLDGVLGPVEYSSTKLSDESHSKLIGIKGRSMGRSCEIVSLSDDITKKKEDCNMV